MHLRERIQMIRVEIVGEHGRHADRHGAVHRQMFRQREALDRKCVLFHFPGELENLPAGGGRPARARQSR
ncbi:hypothetical protein [Burkholderia contaminans]|uniref:hypothetical protein n=1 Tax=Burkholderia contaminans TaxID=488447 RepID=UPI0021AB5D1F|nr:hypothetical protein [Burkholderia contaminans]